jgi:non-lysosomal glucosylceramidase
MNGFEHQLAGHMIREGMVMEGLAIERAIHDRYHAIRRNPWNEVECGDHYARSMASYGVFLAACGFEYHGPKGHIGFAPAIKPENFKAPFVASEGWGSYEQKYQPSGFTSRILMKYGILRLKSLSLGISDIMKPDTLKISLNGKDIEASVLKKDEKLLITLRDEVIIEEGRQLELIC